MSKRQWATNFVGGYEVSTLGDRRFSALCARLKDGRTIEQAYQLDIKGYRIRGNDWRLGKGKPSLRDDIDPWIEYLALWRQWASENPVLIADLSRKSARRVLTDGFAKTPINQAHALALILDEYEQL